MYSIEPMLENGDCPPLTLDGIISGAGGQETDGIGSISYDTFGREEWSFELARRLQLPAVGGRLTKAGAEQVYSDALTYYKEAFGRSMPVRERNWGQPSHGGWF